MISASFNRSTLKLFAVAFLALGAAQAVQAQDIPASLSARHLATHPRCQVFPTPHGNEALINGAVWNPITDRPVAGAVRVIVSLTPGMNASHPVRTDADGLYAVVVPAPGADPAFTVFRMTDHPVAGETIKCAPAPESSPADQTTLF